MLETIATHTLMVDKLDTWWHVLDAGCRDFDFTNEMKRRGHKVISLDPSEKVWEMQLGGVRSAALVGLGKPSKAGFIEAGNGSRVVWNGETTIDTINIQNIVDSVGFLTAVKLDIEGSEYDVLLTWPGPFAGQISVEYHEHTKQGRDVHGKDVYERIAKHLGQWYELVKDDPMDTLWVLK